MIRVLERPVSQLTHHIILSRSKHIVDGPLPSQLRHPPPSTAQRSGHGMQVQTHSPSNQRQAKDTLACDTQRAHGRSQDRRNVQNPIAPEAYSTSVGKVPDHYKTASKTIYKFTSSEPLYLAQRRFQRTACYLSLYRTKCDTYLPSPYKNAVW